MSKKIFALICVVILSLSAISFALCEDSNPGTCGHEATKTAKETSYSNLTAKTHVYTIKEVKRCIYCDAIISQKILEQHAAPHTPSQTIYGFHHGNYHTFYRVCTGCKYRVEQEVVLCPGGDFHVDPNL